jgi:hypothetical protein
MYVCLSVHFVSICSDPTTSTLQRQTGPKGVLQDWQEFQRLQAEKRADQEVKKLQLMEKLSLSCQSYLDEQKERQKAGSDDEFDQLLEQDPFMQQYLKERMSQMMQKANAHTSVVDRFGRLHELKNGDEYVETIDKEDKNVVIVCHFYAPNVEGCETMNGCLRCLAEQYKFVKFCALNTSVAGFSHEFVRCRPDFGCS